MYETGGKSRTHLRGHNNILKRLIVHAGAFNLGMLMRANWEWELREAFRIAGPSFLPLKCSL